MESIDNKDFYKIARKIDNADLTNITSILLEVFLLIFKKTEIKKWFNGKGVIAKRKEKEIIIIEPLKISFEVIKKTKSLIIISESLSMIKNSLKITCYRKEFLKSLIEALEEAHHTNITVYESMINKRNKIRRNGKKIYGNSIGTTLLTKGLEFDTVVLLNTHKYNCPKHLYVAMTRASKKLIVITTNPILNPY